EPVDPRGEPVDARGEPVEPRASSAARPSTRSGRAVCTRLSCVSSTITPLPLSSHAKPIDAFAEAAALEADLRRTIRGEVRFDLGARALYATDASNYRQVPIGLVVPRDDDDVRAAVAACRRL